MSVIFAESQGGSVFRKGIKIHPEEIDIVFPIEIVKLIFVFAVIFTEIVGIHFFEVVEIVGALWIHAFVNNEMPAALNRNKVVETVRALQDGSLGETVVFRWREQGFTDFAVKLGLFLPIIPGQILDGSVASGAGAILRDIGIRTVSDRFNGLVVTFFIILKKILPVPLLLVRDNLRELVDFKLLVFWGVRVIEGPLFQGDVSADEIQ